mgnify:CR=1 FL=1
MRRAKDNLASRVDELYGNWGSMSQSYTLVFTRPPLGLENRKAQLEFSAEERAVEMSGHHEMLTAHVRHLLEDRHNIVLDLAAKQTKVVGTFLPCLIVRQHSCYNGLTPPPPQVDKLAKKYEVLSTSLRPPGQEDDDAEKTQVRT